MSNRTSSNEVANLSLELLKRIPKHRKVTAKELQQQLEHSGIERSLRTIQRNLEMLSRDFDIEKDETNKPYGYRWVMNHSNFSLPTLSPQESVLLSLANNYLASLLPPSILKSIEGFFEEAQYQLAPNEKNQKERSWLKKVRIVDEGISMLAPDINEEIFKNITEALYHDKILNLEYYNANQEEKSAHVMPLGLAQQGKRFYLVCRFEGYENERNIAIHRVSKASVSTFTFKRPSDFKLSEYDANGRFGFSDDKQCHITFCIRKQEGFHLHETPLSKDQTIIEQPDHYQICATLPDSLWLEKWLRGFGDDIWDVKKEVVK